MDFIRFIKSLEDFLYEVATWLLFYPRTLWLAFRRPLALAAYSEHELTQDLREQYTDVVSPPLFLLLTLLLVHAMEMLGPPLQSYRSPVIAKLMDSDVNLLVFRAVAYSLFPLLMAKAELRARGVPIATRCDGRSTTSASSSRRSSCCPRSARWPGASPGSGTASS